MTDPLEPPRVDGIGEAVNAELPQERADGPSLGALLACYAELQRIVEEHRHPRDQAALAIRPDPERRGLLPKAQPSPEAQPQEVCHVVANPA